MSPAEREKAKRDRKGLMEKLKEAVGDGSSNPTKSFKTMYKKLFEHAEIEQRPVRIQVHEKFPGVLFKVDLSFLPVGELLL